MNCARHTDVPAAAYCRTCGKALCENCKREVHGAIYCEDCLASRVQGSAAGTGPGVRSSAPHPAVAGVLAGFFPLGVGQVYNGQYSRGFVYLMVFIGLIWGADHGGPFDSLFGVGIAAYYFFQLIDAVRSARHLQLGLPAPDPFGLDNLFGPGGRPQPAPVAAATAVPPVGTVEGPAGPTAAETSEAQPSHVPTGALILIGLGVLFLLSNMGVFHFWFSRMWPMALIALGVWMLVPRWDEIASGSLQGRRKLMGPAVVLTLGAICLLSSLDAVPFDRSWPLLLIVIGLVLFWQRTAPPAVGTAEPPSTPGPGPEPPQLGPGTPLNAEGQQPRH